MGCCETDKISTLGNGDMVVWVMFADRLNEESFSAVGKTLAVIEEVFGNGSRGRWSCWVRESSPWTSGNVDEVVKSRHDEECVQLA